MSNAFYLRAASALTAAVFAFTAGAEPGVTDNTIILGQTAPLTGPLGSLGTSMAAGIKAYVDQVNKQGGVHGRTIKLIQLDDAYNVDTSVANVNKLINDERAFALLGVTGTPQVAATLPVAAKAGVPFFAPFTGADALRKEHNKYLFTVNASYGREIEKMVEHLSRLTIESIGVVHQNNAFGKDGLAGAEAAFAKHKLKMAVANPVETNSSNVGEAAQAVAKVNPSVVIMATAGKVTTDFIAAYRKAGGTSQFYLLSVADVATLSKTLGKDARGIVVTQTVPYPWSDEIPMVKEYQQAMKQSGSADYNYVSMLGFVSAKTFVETLRATGRNLTRERFVEAAQRQSKIDLGGYSLGYTPGMHHGSQFVDITMISKDGRFLR